MRFLLPCLLLAAATLFTFGDAGKLNKTGKLPPRDDTRNNVVEINGETFFIGLGNSLWSEAKLQCNVLGMQLVTLDTGERWEMISGWLRANPAYDFWTWSAGYKPAGKVRFQWITTGEDFTYTDWNRGEPSVGSADESCMNFMALGYQDRPGWDDDLCSGETYQFMCETPPV